MDVTAFRKAAEQKQEFWRRLLKPLAELQGYTQIRPGVWSDGQFEYDRQGRHLG